MTEQRGQRGRGGTNKLEKNGLMKEDRTIEKTHIKTEKREQEEEKKGNRKGRVLENGDRFWQTKE